MNIAYILPSLRNTAPIKVMHLLCSKMVEHGHRCDVFYLDKLDGQLCLSFPCKTQHVGIMLQEVIFNKYDVIHSTGIRPDILLSLHKKLHRVPKCVTTVHNFFVEDFTSSYGKLYAVVFGGIWMRALSGFEKVITLSKVGINYYSKWFSHEKLEYVYNSIPETETGGKVDPLCEKVLMDFKGRDKLIGCHANLLFIKGIDIAIESLKYLSNIKLVVIGEGKERTRLEQIAKEFGLSDRILFWGFKRDAYKYLYLYDTYIIPSRNEGFSLVLLEAARACTPTVCSDIPIFRELVTSQEVTFFNLNDPKDLADAIINSLNATNKVKLFNRNYYKKYTAENMYLKYKKIYEE